MAKHLCPNTTADQNNYSSPVPFIGLYIAGATLVCFLLMFCDLIYGFRHRKPWIPCRFFSLNSVTLTLLAIAAKLPVDLTTLMPSAYDQLSKLTGTALICVSMGFLLPSLGSNESSECLTNMVAMTILVITVVVNICIQMSTGIIFTFIPELVIIKICMLGMLFLLWSLTLDINMYKEMQMERKQDLITNGKGSMLHQLKLYYLHAYDSEPQFVQCKISQTLYAICLCFLCLVVVLQATFRSLIGHELEFCNGLSDYGWSMRIIIFTQILVILLASLPIGFRWHVFYQDDEDLVPSTENKTIAVITSNAPFLKADTRDYFHAYFRKAVEFGYIIMAPSLLPPFIVCSIIYGVPSVITKVCSNTHENSEVEGIQEYRDLLKENSMAMEEWTLSKCVKDIKRCMTGSEKSKSSSHLRELLSKRLPSQQSLQQLNNQFDFKEGKEASCLYLVFLVRIASASTPCTLCGRLIQSLREVFDIIYFIETTVNSLKTNNRKKCKLAKAMWKGDGLNIATSKESQSDLDHALEVIKESKNVLPGFVGDEVGVVVDFLNSRKYTSIRELYDNMEQLFVDMLHIFLIQLPHAVFKALMESSAEEYEKTAGRMLKFLCQIEHLEDKVQWSFPVGINIASLVTAQASVTDHHITSPVVHNDSDVASHDNVRNALLHEIIQVE